MILKKPIMAMLIASLVACAHLGSNSTNIEWGNGVKVKTQAGKGPRLESTMLVTFPANATEIMSAYYPYLTSVAKALHAYPTIPVVITGYTDQFGNPQKNQFLAQQRALNVKAYLEAEGIAPERMQLVVKAEQDPIASNADAAGRAQNRRVTIQFLE